MSMCYKLLPAAVLLCLLMSVFLPGRGPTPRASAQTVAASADSGPAPSRESLRTLQEERKGILDRIAVHMQRQMEAGRIEASAYGEAKIAALLAGLDLCETQAQRVEIRRAILQWHRRAEAWAQARYQSGRATEVDCDRVRAARLEAEIEWTQAALAR
jgi:hypothetical protein